MILIVISVFATLAFGITAVIFSVREERAIKKLVENEAKQKQRLYEITILKEIQDRIGYSLDVEKVIDVITSSLDGLLRYSAASAIIVKNENLLFKTHLQEAVNRSFIESVKTSMLHSIGVLLQTSPGSEVQENIAGAPFDDLSQEKIQSFFHIPLIVNDRVVGLMNISSTKPNQYTEEEMTMLYKIADLASQALSRLENILSVEKGKLMAMIGSLADGVFMVDINSQLTVINNAAKEFLHVEKENPSTLDILSSLPNSYNFGAKIQKAINHKRVIEEKEMPVGEKVFQIFITPVFDVSVTTEKKVIGVSVLLHDITLEKSIAQMKEDFTNVMVHELRSPLTAIKASTDLLLSGEPGATDDKKNELTAEERHKLNSLISQQSRKMLDEIAFILDAAKLEAGLFTLQKTSGDLKALIESKATFFSAVAHEKFVNLSLAIDPSLPSFSFDQAHVGQVVNNLISNSLKFTPSGGTIKISAKPAIGNVVVSVSDTGVGIPKEKQSLLFSKFGQFNSAHGTNGTGLGLYIVKGIVEAHGGTVKLESEEGKGTTITFTLPLEETKTESAPLLHPAPASAGLHAKTEAETPSATAN
jgi:signal transduction histidine kinase